MQGQLAYDLSSRKNGGMNFIQHVIAKCAKCPARLEFPMVGRHVPEHVVKAIHHKGWEFDMNNRSRARCPDCIAEAKLTRKGDSPNTIEILGKPVVLPASLMPATPAAEPARRVLREFRLVLKSTRTLTEFTRAFGDWADIVSIDVVDLPPEPPVVEMDSTDVTPVTDVTAFNAEAGPAPVAAKPPHPLAGRKVAPRYRNPKEPHETWAGRGHMPRWVRECLADNVSLDDMRIVDH